jgi:hypothetical protein
LDNLTDHAGRATVGQALGPTVVVDDELLMVEPEGKRGQEKKKKRKMGTGPID